MKTLPQLQLLLLFPKTNELWTSLVQRMNHLKQHSAGFKFIFQEHSNMLERFWTEGSHFFGIVCHTSKIGRTGENSDHCDGVHPCSCDSLLSAAGTCGSQNCGRSCCGEWETNILFIRCCDSLYCSKGVIFLLFHFSSKHNLLRYIDHLHMGQTITSGQTACKVVKNGQIL